MKKGKFSRKKNTYKRKRDDVDVPNLKNGKKRRKNWENGSFVHLLKQRAVGAGGVASKEKKRP